MELHVFLAVLAAAAFHASWNAFLKGRLDPVTAMSLIGLAAAVLVLPLVPLFGLPRVEAWPWLIGSMILHLGYFLGLTAAYRTGDLSQVYPIARGGAPLLTALAATLLVHETIGAWGWVGIIVLAAGVVMLSARGGNELQLDKKAVGFALATAVTISGYSLVDGLGARVAGNPHVYTIWLFLLDGIAMVGAALAIRGRPVLASYAVFWKRGVIGGTLSLAAYWIAIWAMTVAPIALVAALRETSVLFAAIIAVVVLKEPLHRLRLVAAGLIVAGLVLIRLQ
jgi:drug/metabolite transporter (DMT)-like permease